MLPHRFPVHRLPLLVASAVLAVSVLGTPVASAEERPVGAGDTVVGELVQAWPEHLDRDEAAEHAHDGPLSWIAPDAGEPVRVVTGDLGDVPVGSTVAVTVGDDVPDAAAEQQGLDPAREVEEATVLEAPPAPGPPVAEAGTASNRVTVVRVLPAAGSTTDPTTAADVAAVVNGSVSSFWSTQTNGAVQIRATAVPGDVTVDAGCDQPFQMWDEVAGDVGFVPGDGNHLLLYLAGGAVNFPQCADGLGTIGWAVGTGGLLYTSSTLPSIIAHELGHNFGLGHSSAEQCDGGIGTGTCQTAPYRDLYDVMGGSWQQIGSLSSLHADVLGVLPSARQQTVVAAGTGGVYALAPVSASSGLRGLRLVDAEGVEHWLEYRTPGGQDGWLGSSVANPHGLESGVLLRRAATTGGDTSILLDGTPTAPGSWASDWQSSLPVGGPVRLSGGDFVITVLSQTSTAATIRIATAQLPIGSLDAVSLSGATLTVRGWAVDPNTPEVAARVHVYVDGAGASLAADGFRPDVGAALPWAGDLHGFSYRTQVAPGAHTVCAYAIDTQGIGNRMLGCRTVTFVSRLPIGSLDVVTVTADGRLAVRGWAIDLDTPTSVGRVHVYVDGRGVSLPADAPRPDVGAAFPRAGDLHGFAFETPVLPGPRRACVYAIDTSAGSSLLGCRSVTYVPRLPIGSLDSVSVSGGVLTVRGWAFDPDTPTTSSRVHVYVDTRGASLAADASRPDVGRAFPEAGDHHGFTFSTPVSPGPHRACVYAIDTAAAGSRLLGCVSVG